MRIAICDDEAAQRELIIECVKRYFTSKKIIVCVEEYESAEQFLFQYDCNYDLDIAILDIQMSGMDGISLAKKLRSQNEELSIIFITAMTDYIFDGFEVKAINYLLKPLNEEKLHICLDKAVNQYSKKERYFALRVEKELIKVKKSQIIRIESDGHYMNIIMTKERYRIKRTMKEIEVELLEDNFFKMSRSDLINLYSIERITQKEVMMVNGDKILIPKGKHREISEVFMNCHFRKEQSYC